MVRSILTVAGIAVAIGSFAVPSFAENRNNAGDAVKPITSPPPMLMSNRVSRTMSQMDQFQARQRAEERRLYAERIARDRSLYASRSDDYR